MGCRASRTAYLRCHDGGLCVNRCRSSAIPRPDYGRSAAAPQDARAAASDESRRSPSRVGRGFRRRRRLVRGAQHRAGPRRDPLPQRRLIPGGVRLQRVHPMGVCPSSHRPAPGDARAVRDRDASGSCCRGTGRFGLLLHRRAWSVPRRHRARRRSVHPRTEFSRCGTGGTAQQHVLATSLRGRA